MAGLCIAVSGVQSDRLAAKRGGPRPASCRQPHSTLEPCSELERRLQWRGNTALRNLRKIFTADINRRNRHNKLSGQPGGRTSRPLKGAQSEYFTIPEKNGDCSLSLSLSRPPDRARFQTGHGDSTPENRLIGLDQLRGRSFPQPSVYRFGRELERRTTFQSCNS